MRLKIRPIPRAYTGKHVEVVGPLGQRVWPPLEVSRTSHNGKVILGCSRAEADGFMAGYHFARRETRP